MQKNNILNNYNKETELTPSHTHFSQENYDKNTVNSKNKEYVNILSNLSINFNNINFKKDIPVYSTLIFFISMSILFGILNKKIDAIISVALLSYITLLLLSKVFILENTRYTKIAIWNLYTSLSMLLKISKSDESAESSIDYFEIMYFSTILYFVSLIVGFIPTISFINILSIIVILISYILAFCNADLDIIKDSLKTIKKYSPLALIISFMLGVTFYNSYALNFAGYITWLILYIIYFAIKDFVFEEI